MRRDSKGMTLIEILIALSIITVVLTIAYSIQISSIKILSKTEIKTMLQTESQVIQNEINKIGMQSSGVIEAIDVNDNDILDDITKSNVFTKVKSLSLIEYLDGDKYIHEFKIEDSILSLVTIEPDKTVKKELSTYVDSINIKPIKDSLKNSESIEIEIILYKNKGFNNINYKIPILINFRNK